VEIHDLSAQQRLLDELGQGLPGNPALAKDMVAGRLDTPGFRQRLAEATAGALLASRYGITKLPAIVFDHGTAVAYGLADVDQAVQRYRRWKAATK
jgi:integrating conjugative element protein (TIGR03757 family)